MVFFFGQDEGEGEIASLTNVIYDLNFFSLFLEKTKGDGRISFKIYYTSFLKQYQMITFPFVPQN